MPWYHGTTHKRFKPGQIVVPGRKVGQNSNWSVFSENYARKLESGRVIAMGDVVWITSDLDEAIDWAHHSTLKALPSEIRKMPAGGIAVYEVEPVELDRPVEQHSQAAAEAICAKARVLREVHFDPFPLDLCDEGCGETATIFRDDEQLCATCATCRICGHVHLDWQPCPDPKEAR